jgi:hypothetical protein
MQAKYVGEELIPPCLQFDQACSVCKALLNHVIDGIYERFYFVVLDFIWVVCFYTALH